MVLICQHTNRYIGQIYHAEKCEGREGGPGKTGTATSQCTVQGKTP